MKTLISSSLKSQQEGPVPLAHPDRSMDLGDGPRGMAQTIGNPVIASGSTAESQRQIGTLPTCRVRRVAEYIQQNLDKALTLPELAAVVHMSPYHFARLFKSSTGLPPHRYVVRQRIARAVALLGTQELSIAQISQKVGFRTASHFSTVFHRAMGTTPGTFRAVSVRDHRSGLEGGSDALL